MSVLKKERINITQWLPIAVIAIILMLIYKTFDNISQITAGIGEFFRILSPLFIGILLTYFLYRPQHFLEKQLKKVKIKKFTFISTRARGISVIIVFIFLIVAIALILAFLLPAIFTSISDLAMNIPGYAQSAVSYLEDRFKDSPLFDINLEKLLEDNAATIVNSLLNSSGGVEQAVGGVISIAGSLTSGLFNVIIGIFLSLYILLSREQMAEYFNRLGNAVIRNTHRRERVIGYFRQINNVLFTFIASKSLDALINFTVATTVLLIFKVPYALLLGLMAGLFNFIPYIGSIISTIVISLLALLTRDLATAGGVALCLLAFQQMDGNFIEPRILKSSLKVNPILVIMAVIVGGAYFGIVGMFLGVPIAVIIKELLQEYITFRDLAPDSDDIRR